MKLTQHLLDYEILTFYGETTQKTFEAISRECKKLPEIKDYLENRDINVSTRRIYKILETLENLNFIYSKYNIAKMDEKIYLPIEIKPILDLVGGP